MTNKYDINKDNSNDEIERFAKINNLSFDEAKEILEEYYLQQEKEKNEVYESLIRGMR